MFTAERRHTAHLRMNWRRRPRQQCVSAHHAFTLCSLYFRLDFGLTQTFPAAHYYDLVFGLVRSPQMRGLSLASMRHPNVHDSEERAEESWFVAGRFRPATSVPPLPRCVSRRIVISYL